LFDTGKEILFNIVGKVDAIDELDVLDVLDGEIVGVVVLFKVGKYGVTVIGTTTEGITGTGVDETFDVFDDGKEIVGNAIGVVAFEEVDDELDTV
jgi:hypothetical protein